MSISREPLEELLGGGGETQSSEFPRRKRKKESEWEVAGKDALADIKITEVNKESTNNTLQGSGAESMWGVQEILHLARCSKPWSHYEEVVKPPCSSYTYFPWSYLALSSICWDAGVHWSQQPMNIWKLNFLSKTFKLPSHCLQFVLSDQLSSRKSLGLLQLREREKKVEVLGSIILQPFGTIADLGWPYTWSI